MSYINNPDITKEDILKKSLAHWNVGKTQEWMTGIWLSLWAKERAIISGIWMAESS